MRKYSLVVRFSLVFIFIAPIFANAVLYFLGAEVFNFQPLFVVAVFAGAFGALLGLATAENNIIT